MTLQRGSQLGPYEIVEHIGSGGMGEVYRARDTRLQRPVAIKVLRSDVALDPEHRQRFEREARVVSSLNHPNICTLYDIGQSGQVGYLVMEYLEGQTLAQRLAGDRLDLTTVLRYSLQIAGALAAAHSAGIVHRDVKPGNIVLTSSDQVKVLDFGLAKLAVSEVAADFAPTVTSAFRTKQGAVLGTVAYMSPEQAEGKPIDARSDIFSFGAVLYEMLTGKQPFARDSHLSTLAAILRDEPVPVRSIRSDLPVEIERVIRRCLEKKPDERYASAVELHADLAAILQKLETRPAGLQTLLRRPLAAGIAVLLLLAVAASVGWLWLRFSRESRIRKDLVELERLLEADQRVEAFQVARRIESQAPADPQLERMRQNFMFPMPIRTDPPGADIHFKPYTAPEQNWVYVGKSPFENLRIPLGYFRWKFTRDGYQTVEVAGGGIGMPSPKLDPSAQIPSGMVRVSGGTIGLSGLPAQPVPEFWMDRFEVTNRQFQEFVNQGGYQKPQYWRHPFVDKGQTLTWEQVMARFRDNTGRPGPAGWELGNYPEDRGDFPVGGVSWFEAAAYAEFAGKSLPTIYHWKHAVGLSDLFSDILQVSNCESTGPARVGSYQGLGPYGTYDMAGNVREWCSTGTEGRHYLLGGAWSDPSYRFTDTEAEYPFERAETNGFRCVRYISPLSDALKAPVVRTVRDFSREKPVSDDVFRIYASLYSYDRSPLDAKTEAVDDSASYWRREKITFRAGYGNERVIAIVFLPRNARPPYQTVVHFPGAAARILRSSDEPLLMHFLVFLIRSGRAVVFPIYKGTYERKENPEPTGPRATRDRVIYWSKDLGRTLDYLETRSDIDKSKLGYYGLSMGAAWGPIMTAIDKRFKASVLLAGGFYNANFLPESDPLNFAPRATTPVLMVNGRHDFIFPLETSQLPMFRLLGAPEKDKRHVLYESGHVPPRMQDVIREILDWYDKYLGPVSTVTPEPRP
ncbi:MAG: bifunctional serine/threonine-protein kinase/formylglycine-generating enzyme family protein [Acidobacteriota bacterium]